MALDFGKLNFSVSFNPTSAFPLDARSYFESYAEAEAAAATAEAAGGTNSTYYFGQTLIVVENNVATFYIIQPNRTLQKIAAGDDVTIRVDSSQFEYDDSGNLSLKGFDTAEAGSYFSMNENGELVWIKPIDAYTKEETDEQISKAVAAADHLKRKVVANLDEAKEYMANNDDANQYIFMVPTGFQETDDKYDEYVVIVVADVPVLEKVGSWEVDLSDYAKVSDLESKVDKEEGSRLITSQEIEKLAGLKQSLITSVNSEAFDVVNGKLELIAGIEQISGIQEALNNKVDKREGYTLLSPTDQQKLAKLTFDSTGDLGVSGTVSAENVLGLDQWISENAPSIVFNLGENNLSSEVIDKLNFITSVDRTAFTVVNGQLQFTPTQGRLITEDEAYLLQQLDSGLFTNYIESVDTSVFAVTKKKLELKEIPNQFLLTTVGDLSTLLTYDEEDPTTIVEEINNIYERLTWQTMLDE